MTQETHQRLPWGVKFFYGLGEIGEGVKTSALEIFLFFYFTQVVGLSGSLTGLALFLALLVDAVIDPVIGAWSDHTHTRLGRRHPFLYAAPIPLAIMLALLFSPPAEASQIVLFVWLFVFASAGRIAMTFYFVPHMALGAELTDDFQERVAVGAYRVFFGYIGRLATLGLAFSIFFKASEGYRNGQLNPAAYGPFALTCGVIVVFAVLVSALGTQRHVLLQPAHPLPKRADSGWVRTLANAFQSKSFRALFYALLILYIFNGVQYALALHMNTYFWQLSTPQIQYVFYAQTFGFMAGIPLARPLAHRFDKKPTYIVGVISSSFVLALPTILRLAGVFPENGDPILPGLLVAFAFAYGVIATIGVVLSPAMLADLADEYELAQSRRAQGLFFGINQFSRKATLGLGGALAGSVIDLIQFPSKATPGAVDPMVLERLGLVYGPGALIFIGFGIWLFKGYRLGRRQHGEVLAQLQAQRQIAVDDAQRPG